MSSRLASENGKYEEKNHFIPHFYYIILLFSYNTVYLYLEPQYTINQQQTISVQNNKAGTTCSRLRKLRLITIYMLLSEDPRVNIWKVGKCMKICQTCTVVYWQTICKLCVYFFSAMSSS